MRLRTLLAAARLHIYTSLLPPEPFSRETFLSSKNGKEAIAFQLNSFNGKILEIKIPLSIKSFEVYLNNKLHTQNNMLPKHLTLTALLFFLKLFCFSQTINVLEHKTQKFYSEQNQFEIGSTLKLINNVGYDDPHSVDEEHEYILTLDIIDTTNAKLKKVLNLTLDTSIIKCKFDISSVWNWEEENTINNGDVIIRSWTNKKIELQFNINVLNTKTGKNYMYKGKRTFFKK